MAESETLLAVPSSKDMQPMKRNSSMYLPPYLSELRVVILGNDWSEKSSVGNFLLGEKMFKPEEPDCCQRANAPLKEKQIIVVNTPDLLYYSVNNHKLSDHMEACANLSHPGPHVFLLVLQPQDFNEEQKQKLCTLLENFSEQSFNHVLVLVSEPREGSPEPMDKYQNHPPLKDMIRRCNYRYLWRQDLEFRELFTRLGQIVRENHCDHVICEMFDRPAAESEGLTMSAPSVAPGLNLILCGRRGPMKTSAVKAILGQSASHPVSSECVKNQGKVCGRQVSMVELPPLHGKSQQAVEESFRCISLFDPVGVHAFILVVPVGPLIDEDKAELESIQSTFGSAVNELIMIIFSGKSAPMAESVREDREIQELCEQWGLRYIIITMENQQQISDMFQKVEDMGFRCYTKNMFTKAQMDKLVMLQGELQEERQRRVEEGESRESLRALEKEMRRKDGELRIKHDEIGALKKKNIQLKEEVDQERKLKSKLDQTIQRERDERRKEKEEECRRRSREDTQRQEMKRKLDLAEKTAILEKEERENAEKKMETYRREMRRDREAWDKERKDMWERRFQEQKENLEEVKSSRKELLNEYTHKRRKWMYIVLVLSLLLVIFYMVIYGLLWLFTTTSESVAKT